MAMPLIAYRRLPLWTAETLPTVFRKRHNTKEGTWAKLTVLEGKLKFYALSEAGEEQSTQEFSPLNPAPFIEPQAWHRVEPASDDLQCYLEFYCEPERYFEKKYKLSAPHSAAVGVLKHISGGDALDLGCGRGRNSIYLHSKGFKVTALDHSETAISKLNEIVAAEESCRGIETGLYDISRASLSGSYDLIVSTVVLQFLPADRIEAVLGNMQLHTRPGGINVIVAPISSDDFPCPIDWPFCFREGELGSYYDGWSLLEHDESVGTFHRLDEHGNRYRARFVTLMARKVA